MSGDKVLMATLVAVLLWAVFLTWIAGNAYDQIEEYEHNEPLRLMEECDRWRR